MPSKKAMSSVDLKFFKLSLNEGATPDKARELLAAGANPSITNANGMSPMHYYAASGRIDMLEALVGVGANVNVQSKDGHTPLMSAARNLKIGAMAFLIGQGADETLATNGNPPLTAEDIFKVFEMAASPVGSKIRAEYKSPKPR